jgi:hypothetical protein
MNVQEFRGSLAQDGPSEGISLPLQALWWDAKGDWTRAHDLVDDLETIEAMAVHAYLHRKQGVQWNADYWYSRAGTKFQRPAPEDEWTALVEGIS